ncbi:MAG: tetratricopeptide repeat protein [Vulcanimicrobiota bacterium]
MDFDELMEHGSQAQAEADYEQAVDYFSRAVALRPDDPDARLSRAIALRDGGRDQEARLEIEYILGHFEETDILAIAHQLLGHFAFVQDDYRAAVREHRRSIALDPRNTSHQADLADCLFFLGHPSAALRHYRPALHNPLGNPRWREHLWKQAVLHASLGQWRAMSRCAEDFLALYGWKHELSPYAAVYAALADPSRASALREVCPRGWPRPVLDFIARPDRLRPGKDRVQQIEAQVYEALFWIRTGDVPGGRARLRSLEGQACRQVFEVALAQIWLRHRRPARPRPERIGIWLWGADQQQLDDVAPWLAQQGRLGELCLALELGARPPDCRPVLEFLERADPLVVVRLLSQLPELLEEAKARLDSSHRWLHRLKQVPHLESLTVIHVPRRRAARLRVSGVVDNFQLQVLLADLLVPLGWPGKRPLAEIAGLFRGQGFANHPEESGHGVWNLYRYDALQSDGRLRPFLEGDDPTRHWVWSEGSFYDIPLWQGERVLLLGPPAAKRTFNASRIFELLPARVELIEETGADPWLARLPRAKIPIKPV